MKSKPTLAIWAGSGIGGAEKAATLFAVALAQRGFPIVYLSEPGPRTKAMATENIQRISPPEDAAAMAAFLCSAEIDVVHHHVPGYPHHTCIYDALHALGDRRPRLIESNIFGRLDNPKSDCLTDFRCFVSSASAVQAYRRKHRSLDLDVPTKATVIYNPLAPLVVPVPSRREITRRELGVEPHELLLLRIGRAGHKWNWDEVRTFQAARRANPALRLLLMEPREEVWREVAAGRWGEGIILQRELSDFDRLADIYLAGDLMLHMSDWGESFGYTIAEAMQYGLPVVTRVTPWGDNAQVELVEQGVTGYVCNSPGGAAAALGRLAAEPELRRSFATESVRRISRLGELQHESNLLEEIIHHLVDGSPTPLVAKRNRELLRFETTFSSREKRVIESEMPGLRMDRIKGSAYGAYRVLRSKLGSVKAALKAKVNRA